MWTFAEYIGIGTDAATIGRTEEVFKRLRSFGYFGSGATPNDKLVTEADWVAYAKHLDQVDEQARKAGQTLMVHTHDWGFTKVYNGRTAYEILASNTSTKNVVFQLDLYWAVTGGQDPVALLRRC